MNNPLVSIITVCYNSERTIKDTIESVFNQNYSHLEYIIIDGNSSDKTLAIIKSYETDFNDKGITYKWISESDNGIYDAMNKGISIASGELIGIIGSDDWYELNAVEHIVNQYNKDQADYIHGNMRTYSTEKKLLKVLEPGPIKEMIKRMSFFHSASFIKKEVYHKLDGYSLDYTICSDYDFILKVIKNNYNISYVNEIISNFSYGGISTSRVKEALYESHLVRTSNDYSKFLSAYYYYRALLINSLKKIFISAP